MTLKEMLQRHTIYKCCMILVLLCCSVMKLHLILSPYLRIFIVWGGIIILLDFIKGRRIWHYKDIFILLAFCALYAVSIIIVRGDYFTANLKALAYMTVGFLTIYGGAYHEDIRLVKKEIDLIGNVLLIALFVITMICFATFMLSFQYRYYGPDEMVGFIGMTDGRLGGLFGPNVGGAFYAAEIILALSMLASESKTLMPGHTQKLSRRRRTFLLLVCTFAYLCLAMSDSRTAIYALAISLFAGVMVYLTDRKGIRRFAAAAGVAALVILAAAPVQRFLPQVQCAVHMVIGDIDIFPEQEKSNLGGTQYASLFSDIFPEIDKQEVSEEFIDALSGRPVLWEKGLTLFAESPVFGITNEPIHERAMYIGGDKQYNWALPGGGLHSTYLTILVASGIIGAVTMLIFAVVKIKRFIHRDKKNTRCPEYAALLMLLIFMLISEALETRVLYQFNIYFVIFWGVLGYMTVLDGDTRQR